MNLFAIAPIEIALDDRLSKTQIRVLLAILSFRNKNTNLCWPSREQIQERCGLDVHKISNATTALVELGWLNKVGNGGNSRRCTYEVIVPDIENTVPESGTVYVNSTVPELGTMRVPELGTMRVPELGTMRVPELVTGIKQTIKQTNKQTIKQTIPTPPFSDEKDSVEPVKKNKQPETSETWNAYSESYFNRYGVEPVRNATVSGQLAQLIKRLGKDESPHVASFYVNHNNQFYVQKMHTVGLLLADAEKLRTEWATRRQVTNTQAKQADKKQATSNVFNQLIEERRTANGDQ